MSGTRVNTNYTRTLCMLKWFINSLYVVVKKRKKITTIEQKKKQLKNNKSLKKIFVCFIRTWGVKYNKSWPLLSNAIQFGDQGKRLHLVVTCCRRRQDGNHGYLRGTNISFWFCSRFLSLFFVFFLLRFNPLRPPQH